MDESEHARKVVKAVMHIIASRLHDPMSLEGLTDVEADLISTITAKGVIDNGGHVYWFEGMDAEDTRRTAVAFDRLDLPAVAESMRTALLAFPGSVPPKDLAAIQGYVSVHRAELEETFRELDRTVWDADYYTAARNYIERHRALLSSIAPQYAAALRLQ